jgi:hypothetical protein
VVLKVKYKFEHTHRGRQRTGKAAYDTINEDVTVGRWQACWICAALNAEVAAGS